MRRAVGKRDRPRAQRLRARDRHGALKDIQPARERVVARERHGLGRHRHGDAELPGERTRIGCVRVQFHGERLQGVAGVRVVCPLCKRLHRQRVVRAVAQIDRRRRQGTAQADKSADQQRGGPSAGKGLPLHARYHDSAHCSVSPFAVFHARRTEEKKALSLCFDRGCEKGPNGNAKSGDAYAPSAQCRPF